MRNFVITVNGKSYEVGVEEVGATASAPVAAAPKAAVSAPQARPHPLRPRPKQLLQTEKKSFLLSPDSLKICLSPRARR